MDEITDAMWERPEWPSRERNEMDFLKMGAGILDTTLAAHGIAALKLVREEGKWTASMRLDAGGVRVSAPHDTPGGALVDLLKGGKP